MIIPVTVSAMAEMDCPKCGAEKGCSCHTPAGEYCAVHSKRIRAYLEAASFNKEKHTIRDLKLGMKFT